MKKIVFWVVIACAGLIGIVIYQYVFFHDGRLHIVFCDVGQGDGILITTPTNKHLLIDSGPDKKIIDCLTSHLPFWQKTIDVALLTHPHADHFIGYYYVIDRYSLSQFSTENLRNKAGSFFQLEKLLQQKNIAAKFVAAGDTWHIAEVTIAIAAPTDEFVTSKNPDRFITSSAESASLVTLISYRNFKALLTGDAPIEEMEEVAQSGISNLQILQIPHHGSSTGIDGNVLDLLAPRLAVISVGAENHYGHPTKQTLDLLKERNIPVLRTDQRGDIEVVSDGDESHLR